MNTDAAKFEPLKFSSIEISPRRFQTSKQSLSVSIGVNLWLRSVCPVCRHWRESSTKPLKRLVHSVPASPRWSTVLMRGFGRLTLTISLDCIRPARSASLLSDYEKLKQLGGAFFTVSVW